MKKSFLGVSFYPGLWGKWDRSPCLILTVFVIWTERATTPNACVIYLSCMIYVSVQFYALCPFLLGVTLSFNTNCLIMPYTTLLKSASGITKCDSYYEVRRNRRINRELLEGKLISDLPYKKNKFLFRKS